MTELESLLAKNWVKRDGSVDQRMVDYCLKSSKYIDIGEYYLNIGNSKPGIDSTMWYDDETEGPDDSKFSAFRAYNLRGGNARTYDELVADGRTEFWVFINSYRDMTGGKIKAWTVTRPGDEPNHVGNFRKATDDDIMAIKQGLAEIRADYEKRLERYWKRYSNKVHAAGYWANR
jgi:hypothetical protein